MNTKTFQAAIELKADGTSGEFSAGFATLNVIDLDGDVTLPGAFKKQRVIIEPWNHNWGELPVGKGSIHEADDKAIAEGKFFLDTIGGSEHYKVVKNLEDQQEWSYSFDIVDSSPGEFNGQKVRFLKKLVVIGVGPVTRGAGIDTATLRIKGVKAALPAHSTPTTDAAWDGPAMTTRCMSGESTAYYRKIFAWMDPEGDPAVKSTYKFVHHMVAGDGTPGAANIRGCQTGIGVLNGGRGGTTIPDADRWGVWNHLAKHLRDADVEPPELKSAGDQGQTGDGEPRNPPPSVVASLIRISELED